MYRILLVDDEWLELDTLEKYIPWEEMGFTVAGTAQNGIDALALLQRMKERQAGIGGTLPEVLLTDVKMPQMDGIELGRLVRERYPDMQIVFLSGYHEFEYVRSALAMEACGYILKPLVLEELRETMGRVKEKCDQTGRKWANWAAFTTETIKKLLSRGKTGEGSLEMADWEELRRICNSFLGCPASNKAFYLGLLTIDEYHFLSAYEADRRILEKLQEQINAFSKSESLLSFRIFDDSCLLLSLHPFEKSAWEWMEKRPEMARWTTICLYEKPHSLESLPDSIREMRRFRQWSLKLYGSGNVISCDGSDKTDAEGEGDRRAEIVRQVKLMIEKEYGIPITIERLADKVYMSPNYLRTLFKEYAGVTILEYLTEVRMRQSAMLLTDTNLRIHEISQKVGYENPSHYCAVFKKQMGMTPNQYRERMMKKGKGSTADREERE